MRLSNRIQNVSPSATIAITTKAKELQAEGVDVVSFGAGEPDFDTPDFIKAAAKVALDGGDTKYNPRQGRVLLQAIADKLARENGLTFGLDQIVVTFGGKHAIYDVCQCLIDPGDRVLVPAPYWVSYPQMVRLAGGEPVIIPAAEEAGFKITPQQILDAADGAKALILNSPCNPTGVTYTPAELGALAEAVAQTDLIVITDEIYEKLVYGETEFRSFLNVIPEGSDLAERTVLVSGLAKTFSMTGWRLGWIAGPADLVKSVRKIMSHETTNPVSFAQAGAVAAYTHPDSASTVEGMRQEFERRGAHMAKRLRALPNVKCVEPTGAFYCFPDVSAHYGRTLGGQEVTDSMSFCQAALAAAGVALVPGSAFGEDRCVRLSFATALNQIDAGLDRLAEFLA